MRIQTLQANVILPGNLQNNRAATYINSRHQFTIAKLVLVVELCPNGVVAVTASVCVPFENSVVSIVVDHPTFGQPDRPG